MIDLDRLIAEYRALQEAISEATEAVQRDDAGAADRLLLLEAEMQGFRRALDALGDETALRVSTAAQEVAHGIPDADSEERVRMPARPIPADLEPLVAVINQAIRQQRPLVLRYDGYPRAICPHALGWKGHELHCLVYQFAGASRSDLEEGGVWRCFKVTRMAEVLLGSGEWHTEAEDPNPHPCIDEVIASVR